MSALAEAITNLHAFAKSTLANVEPTVQVIDGQPVEDFGQEVLAIGMTAEDLAVEGTEEDAGLWSTQETFDISCLIVVWSGGTDLVALRTRADALYETVKKQVMTNPTLDGAVARARMLSLAYSPMRMPEGTRVNMTFRVRCTAFNS